MSKYSKLLTLLRDRSDQSQDALKILIAPEEGDQVTLAECGIRYEQQAEGFLIDCVAQTFKIFKTKASAVRFLGPNDFSVDIVVLEKANDGENIVYENNSSESKFFENILYVHKFKELFIDDSIASYHDELSHKIIFLSAKHGRLDVGYNKDLVEEFYDQDHDLEHQFNGIESTIIEDSQYKDFFRESFIEFSKNLPDEHTRFIQSLASIRHIAESAARNHELYKHNFSFAEFKRQLDEDKKEYFKEYQSNLSDFLLKIASMPIQFGVYIFLISRHSKEIFQVLAITALIITWSWFTVSLTNSILENIKYLKGKFMNEFSRMLQQSGIDEAEVKQDQNQIVDRFNRIINLLKGYRATVIIFSLCAVAFCWFLYMELQQIPDIPEEASIRSPNPPSPGR